LRRDESVARKRGRVPDETDWSRMIALGREHVFTRKSVLHDPDESGSQSTSKRMRSGRHRISTSSANLAWAVFIDITSSDERSPGNDLVAQKASLSGQHLLSPAHSILFRAGPRWRTPIVGPINLAGGALVGEQGRASRFAPWRIAALALSGEPRFQRDLGGRRVLTPEELKAFPA
jgi:hypothetical protein